MKITRLIIDVTAPNSWSLNEVTFAVTKRIEDPDVLHATLVSAEDPIGNLAAKFAAHENLPPNTIRTREGIEFIDAVRQVVAARERGDL